MDINIVNLSEDTIKKLDILAKKKGISREELLYKFIENISNQEKIYDVFSRYEILLKRIEKTLNNNTKALNELIDS